MVSHDLASPEAIRNVNRFYPVFAGMPDRPLSGRFSMLIDEVIFSKSKPVVDMRLLRNGE